MRRWTKVIKGMTAVLAAVVVAAGGMKMPVKAASPGSDAKVKITVPGGKTPVYQYQKAQDFVLEIKNTGAKDITDLIIRPKLQGDDGSKWPFKIEWQEYCSEPISLSPDESKQVKFNFTERDNIETDDYPVSFSYESPQVSGSETFYIRATQKPETKDDVKDSAVKSEGGGSVSNGEASYSDGGSMGGGSGDGGSGGNGSVPRVIVTGFSTNPEVVKAGSDFTLTIHLKNTSKKSRVNNMLFDLNAPVEGADEQTTAPAFLPSSGSSSVYLEGIKANGTADISINLNAKADLLQKPYSVELSMKYEDADYNGVEASSSLSIPIKQDARFEFSEIEVNPETISVDEEANVMCNLYNLGRIKLYNVKATFEGACIEKEEVFIGNVESGTQASVDAMLKGVKETGGPAAVKMTMSYENEEGEVFTEEKEITLEVAQAEDEAMEDMAMEGEEGGKSFPVIAVIAVLIVAAAVAGVIVVRKKKRKGISEEEDLLNELDRTSEDEQQ